MRIESHAFRHFAYGYKLPESDYLLAKIHPFELTRLECNVNTGKTQLFRGVTTHSDGVDLPLLKFKIH